MKKIKVGVVLSGLKNQGPVNVVRTLVNKRKSVKYTIFCLSDNIDDIILSEFIDYGVEVYFTKENSFFKRILFLYQILKKHPQDVIHSHGITADLYCCFIKNKKISTVHNRLLEDYIPLFGFFVGHMAYYVHAFILGRFNHLVSCAESVDVILENAKINPNKSVIRNGVNLEKFKVLNPDEKEKLRVQYGFDHKDNILVYCGSLSKRKNVIGLLKRLQLNANDRLIIVGDGPLDSECRKIVEHDARYIFTGSIESPVNYYQIANVFLSASESEGFPLALLEAYASGCILFVSNIPSHAEISHLLNNNCIYLFDLSDMKINIPNNIFENVPAHQNFSKISDAEMSRQYELLFHSIID
ncbi:glycosyltransferase [Buttiauxella sp. 3AFRM03]|uniref:glycosyltransferase n=1 Tax=Buttiauxella sp. 3AFRM03 TaxID=2479367 RepID=UPI000EF81B0D|nr:glycosyltransferase [Buttiauxella sp. 3AFRM03]AYN29777.1 glycosyltransferase [Buttiauxella sp. 3AFRM03]